MSSQPTHEWPASKSISSLERTPRSGRLHMSFVLPLPQTRSRRACHRMGGQCRSSLR